MIELYQKEDCPYCKKVRQFLGDNCIDWLARSADYCIHQREKLQELGGKQQAPFLVDPERKITMYESDDIIAYLKKNYIT